LRIAHATDIHWIRMPPWSRMAGKRILGTLNVLRGRGKHFSNRVQRDLVQHMIELDPDLVILTGDLTQTALPSEFEAAKHDLQPLLDTRQVFIVPGNHDVYTRGARDSDRISQFFAAWMHRADAPIGRLDQGELTVLGLDPCRPGVLSSGLLPDEQLDALAKVLAEPEMSDRTVVLALHYPILDPRGAVYDNISHGLTNASDLIDVLTQAPTRPALIIHGHEHHGFHVMLDDMPIHNSGSSGYGFEPGRRAAYMNVYDLQDGRVVDVERYMHDGKGWTLEPGGPYNPESP